MSKKQKKVILSCAITGAIHTPTMSPYLPAGVDGLVKAAVDAAEAGASIIHVHARKEDGEPTSDLNFMRQILRGIKAKTDVVVGITTGGAIGMSVEERLAAVPEFKPEMASCNAGSMNFCLSELANGMDEPLHEWEVPFLKASYGRVFQNTFSDMEYCIKIMNECGTLPEFEVFDLGQINNIAYFKRKGIITQPIYIQFVLGVMGGAPLTIDNIRTCIAESKRLLGDDFQFSIVAGGRRAFRLEAMNAIQGGNCRVGMEDSLYISSDGTLAESNAQQVEKMIRILHDLDFEVATPDEAREMLHLKGADKVNY